MSTAYLQAKQDGTFEVVTPHATQNGGTSFSGLPSGGSKLSGDFESNKISINVR